jgi:hypothetical protein
MNDSLPWYRQFWPWFIFGLPGVVVIAGLTTWWIAEENADYLVADDYYQQGLAINRELEKQRRAEALGLQAELAYDGNAIDVTLGGEADPAALILYISHPLDAKRDRELLLPRIAVGHYRSPVALEGSARWLWQLQPANPAEGWRLDGELRLDHVDAP